MDVHAQRFGPSSSASEGSARGRPTLRAAAGPTGLTLGALGTAEEAPVHHHHAAKGHGEVA